MTRSYFKPDPLESDPIVKSWEELASQIPQAATKPYLKAFIIFTVVFTLSAAVTAMVLL